MAVGRSMPAAADSSPSPRGSQMVAVPSPTACSDGCSAWGGVLGPDPAGASLQSTSAPPAPMSPARCLPGIAHRLRLGGVLRLVEKGTDAGSGWRILRGGGDGLVDHLPNSRRVGELTA